MYMMTDVPLIVNAPIAKILNDSTCTLCTNYLETTIHVFKECPFIKNLWGQLEKRDTNTCIEEV